MWTSWDPFGWPLRPHPRSGGEGGAGRAGDGGPGRPGPATEINSKRESTPGAGPGRPWALLSPAEERGRGEGRRVGAKGGGGRSGLFFVRATGSSEDRRRPAGPRRPEASRERTRSPDPGPRAPGRPTCRAGAGAGEAPEPKRRGCPSCPARRARVLWARARSLPGGPDLRGRRAPRLGRRRTPGVATPGADVDGTGAGRPLPVRAKVPTSHQPRGRGEVYWVNVLLPK